MIDDVFCKIINKQFGADIIAEGKNWIAFHDIHPAAPIHVLIVPKKHIDNLTSVEKNDVKLMGELILAVKEVASILKLDEKGYRLILNCGEHGGQLVPHLHFHLLGGKKLGKKIIDK